ncbi:glycerol-3-phosphate O-acyltransferase [Dokdonella fugitiva]|uniref:Glycerol-3-phosphate acyltransferase n=1 Tax=Dokdonella fugitiva TaxID=328517 RepID=A0A839F1B6_9GAMM|nr:glycerol-3-phosphate 1-O-acyltransferase PlsB [Dokdonella fugitiva]MBA8887298.1 glycerol-3-phosphate O-acyltransferase [Dokdonella fugitiva]
MNDSQPAPRPPEAAQVPAWLKAFGALLRPWIRIHRTPEDVHTLLPEDARPTVYVIERYGLSDTLILEQACAEAGLPSPYAAADQLPIKRRRAVVALSRRPRVFGRQPHPTRSETLSLLADIVRAHPEQDVRLVPVSIFVGRAPDRESGWFSVLFSENWVVVGRFRRLLALALNGRDTHVQFAAPVSLREVIADQPEAERGVRKLQRILRAHFRRIRAAVIGPDLSHRRTLIDGVVNAAPVQQAIDTNASKEGIDRDKAARKARAFAWEIAADQSHLVVRSASFMLTGLWEKIYRGVHMNHFAELRKIVPGHEVVFVPCHRSTTDDALLPYLLYRNGLTVPHIAAGVNLNLPLIGPLLRRGGAFFLRRSFSDPFYSTVFREYMSQLIARGISLMYFIEGGRSRTGRTLEPRGGLLSMTLRSFLRQPERPVVFQPVYIGYEKIMEGESYIGELSGKPKEKESWGALLRGLGALRDNYGAVTVNFGEPLFLTPLLDQIAPDWRSAAENPDAKPAWLKAAVDTLGERILVNINRAAHANPINLLAVALLATPKHAMAEADLLAQLELYKALLSTLPYSERVTLTSLGPAEIIAYGEKMQWIRRVAHPLGDVLTVDAKQGVLLSYFRNNVTHLFATASWVACCFLNNRRLARTSILRLGRLIYPFVQAELFLPWSEDEFGERIQKTLDFFIAQGLLEADADGRIMERGPGQSDPAFRLRALAHTLLPAIERYYIGLALLVKNGPHTLTAGELENLCYLSAQRLSLLHELNAPEFFDRSLFRGFIQKLRERRVVWADENGKLDFDLTLEEVAKDARVILSREIRHGILKLTPEKQAELTRSEAAASTQA